MGRAQSGNATILVLVMAAMAGSAFPLFMKLGRSHQDQTILLSENAAIDAIRANLIAHFENQAAVAKTIQMQSGVGKAFECYGGASCSGVERALDFYDGAGGKFVAESVAAQGFDWGGSVCQSFSSPQDRSCFVRVQLTWIPTCPGGCAVTQPSQIKVRAKFVGKTDRTQGYALNLDRHVFEAVLQ